MIYIEFFGVPRLLVGAGQMRVDAANVGEALECLTRACPALVGAVVLGREVHRAYRLSLNAERFVSDPETPLVDGDVLILLAADAGG